MAAVTICSDIGAQEKSLSLFPLFPHLFAMKWWTECHDLNLLNVEFHFIYVVFEISFREHIVGLVLYRTFTFKLMINIL